MSFEFINTSVTYQQIINNAFKNLLNVIVITYFNNILIYLKNFAKHKKHVKQIFKHLIKYNLCFKSKKCK